MSLLSVVDYVVIGVMLAISMGIGVYFAVRGKNTREGYLLGNRQMGVVSVSISMFVTLQSAIALLGFPAEIYTYGTMILYIFIAYVLTYLTAIYTCLPLLYPLHITSIYEYLGRRYDSTAVRMLGTTIGMLYTILYMAVSLLSPALALQASAGIPLWMSIVIVGIVGTLYTSVGGLKSVVWTDVVQSVFMLVGSVLVIILGMGKVGTFADVIDINKQENRFQLELSPDPRVRHTMWGIVIGGFINWNVNQFNQSTVQRLFAIKTMRGAKLAFLLNIPLILLYGVILSISGLLMVAYFFTTKCDPYEAGYITNRNQLMPYFVLDILGQYPGLSGLYMATLFSGALSTLSSGINALAANTVEDVLAVPLRKASERTVTIVAKLSVCFYGLLAIGLAYLARALQGPVTQMSMTAMGATGGPILGMFFLGGAFPWANKVGALCGGVCALVINVVISVLGKMYGVAAPTLHPAPTDNCTTGSELFTNTTPAFLYNMTTHHKGTPIRPFNLYDVSYIWYSLIGFVVVVVVGGATSFLSQRRNQQPRDYKFLFPFARKLWKKVLPSQLELASVDNCTESNGESFILQNDTHDLNHEQLASGNLSNRFQNM